MRRIVGEVEHRAHRLGRHICLCHRKDVYFVPSICCLFTWFVSLRGPHILQNVPVLSCCFVKCLMFPWLHGREDAIGENVPRSHGLGFRMTTRGCYSARSCAQMQGCSFNLGDCPDLLLRRLPSMGVTMERGGSRESCEKFCAWRLPSIIMSS